MLSDHMFRVLVFLCCVLCFAPAQAEPPSVGVIDMGRVMTESALAKLARTDLESLRREKEKLIFQSAGAIETLEQQVNANLDLRPEARQKLIDDLQRKQDAHQRLVSTSTEELRREERLLYAYVERYARLAMKRVAERAGYALIISDPDAVGYVTPKLDITELVLKELGGTTP